MSETRIFDTVCKIAKEKGLSINSLEKKAGISTGGLYKWKTSNPTLKSLSKIATALNCTIDDIVNDSLQKAQ